jgi:hypothetical protein
MPNPLLTSLNHSIFGPFLNHDITYSRISVPLLAPFRLTLPIPEVFSLGRAACLILFTLTYPRGIYREGSHVLFRLILPISDVLLFPKYSQGI